MVSFCQSNPAFKITSLFAIFTTYAENGTFNNKDFIRAHIFFRQRVCQHFSHHVTFYRERFTSSYYSSHISITFYDVYSLSDFPAAFSLFEI